VEAWKKAAVAAGVGFAVFSLLPIWRSGRNGGLNLWQFLHHHSVFSKSEALWIRRDELEVIKRMAGEGRGQ